jgi:phage repressor protein C with HTH and peptisase S24 domain
LLTPDQDIEKIIKKIVKSKNLTMKALCQEIDMSERGLKLALTRETINLSKLKQISSILSISMSDLFKLFEESKEYEGLSVVKEDQEVYLQELIKEGRYRANIIYVPLRATAGYLAGNTQEVEQAQRIYIPGFENETGTFNAFHTTGDSMWNLFSNGDLVIGKKLESLDQVRPMEPYIIDTYNDGQTVKRVKKAEEEHIYTLISENTFYPPYNLHARDIRSMFLVVGFVSANTGPRSDNRIQKLSSPIIG